MKKTEEEQISQLLASLEPVKAPGDFHIRVRSRIAAGTGLRQRAVWPRFAVPAALLGALAVVLAFGWYFASDVERVVVVENPPVMKNQPETGSSEVQRPAIEPDQFVARDDKPVIPQAPINEKRSVPSRTATARKGRESEDLTQRKGQTILPSGLDPRPDRPQPQLDFDPRREVPIGDILTIIGIAAEQQNGRWIASSVHSDSPASRAGIQPGDAIETLNEIEITDRSGIAGGVAMKSIGVRRAGRQIVLNFK